MGNQSIGEIGDGGGRVSGLGLGGGLGGVGGRDGLPGQLSGQIRNPFEIKSVEELEREDDLVKLDLPGHPLEDPTPAGHRQVRVLVSQVRPLHRHVPVIPEVEAVNGLVAVPFLLRHVLNQHAEPRRNAEPLLQVAGVELVGERHEVAQ